MAKTPCSQCRGPRFYFWSKNQIAHATTKDAPNATMKTEDPTCCNKTPNGQKKKKIPATHKQVPSNEAGKQLNPTGATSLAGETPRKRLSSTDLSGREVGGREGVQLISAERRNISGNFCAQEAQEDRTLPSGLCLLELRLFPDKSQNNLSGEPTSCGQNPHSWESFHSSSDPTMDALSALPSSHSPSQSYHYQFQ